MPGDRWVFTIPTADYVLLERTLEPSNMATKTAA
jgi:hypothetical protein